MSANDERVRRAHAIAESCKPLLAGAGGDVQGAALCELVALHLAGHPVPFRERLLGHHVETVRALIPVVELELFGPNGHPSRDA